MTSCLRPAPSPSACARRRPSCASQRTAASAAAAEASNWEAVVGLEVHVQLNTATKAFCGCASVYGAQPNAHTCPVCLGLPGTLPVFNRAALDKAVLLAKALRCRLSPSAEALFDRKHYFYADLPKGFQTSQHDSPLASSGLLRVPVGGAEGEAASGPPLEVRIERAHLEEDSAKLTHVGGAGGALAGSTHSLADFNRAGCPLVEVVSGPDMRSGREAAAYAQELQRLVRWLGVGDGNMAEGSLRVDVNVSVRRRGEGRLGTKVEVKNMNSFANVGKAVDFEFARQVALLEEGREEALVQETRLWDEARQRTVSMRSKEGLADYRHVREPDLCRLPCDSAAAAASLPELPGEARLRFERDYLLPPRDAALVAEGREGAAFLDACVAAGAEGREAAKWLLGDIAALLRSTKRASVADCALRPEALAELLQLVGAGTLSGKMAKELLPELVSSGGSAAAALARAAPAGAPAGQLSDEAELEALVRQVLDANPTQLAEFRAGKDKLKGFFSGQLMKASGGRANPKLADSILSRLLKGK